MNIPSYEEYKQATSYAKFKYRWGWVVLTLTWLCLLFVIYYMVVNGEALASHPLIYGAEKLDVECHCYSFDKDFPQNFYVNSTTLWINTRSVEEDINWSEFELDW